MKKTSFLGDDVWFVGGVVETNKHGLWGLCQEVVEELALLSFDEGIFLLCELMFSTCPTNITKTWETKFRWEGIVQVENGDLKYGPQKRSDAC